MRRCGIVLVIVGAALLPGGRLVADPGAPGTTNSPALVGGIDPYGSIHATATPADSCDVEAAGTPADARPSYCPIDSGRQP